MLDCLRNNLGLTGTKEGCGTGDCGACSVTVDGRLVCSCLVLGVETSGKKIETIEGLAKGDELTSSQTKFLEHAALQCGVCTPGFLVALQSPARPKIQTRPKPKFATGWPAISAAAPATTKSSAPCMDAAEDMQQTKPKKPSREHEPCKIKSTASPASEFNVIGTRPIRPDGIDKVTGRARFGADYSLPGQLVGKVLRSPHPHARIKKIDISAALKT